MKALLLMSAVFVSWNSYAQGRLLLICQEDEVRGTISVDADSSCDSKLSASLSRDVRACVESKNEPLEPGLYQVCGKLNVEKNLFVISRAVDGRLR